jgi:hypothetical protein
MCCGGLQMKMCFVCYKLCISWQFVPRVLDDSDPDIQAKTLDCLLNWKDEFLTPYSQNLKNLIDIKTLREELTTWAVSHDSSSILKDHRSRVVPLVVRVLAPKGSWSYLVLERFVFAYCLSIYDMFKPNHRFGAKISISLALPQL